MDNATEALFMGAAVLVFMVAVSLTLSSFSTFRNDLEDIILADERIDMATQKDSTGKESYINYISSSQECRTVGIDTLANSLYRVYKENYIVVIKLNDEHKNEYGIFEPNNKLEKYSNCLIKPGNTTINGKIVPNIKVQTYKGSTIIDANNDPILVFDIPNAKNDKEYINKVLDEGLYDLLKDKTFTEYTGVYYENDTVPIGTTGNDLNPTDGQKAVSVANKTKARVITYIEQ